jgi:molybdopterin biosynthesis enzyme
MRARLEPRPDGDQLFPLPEQESHQIVRAAGADVLAMIERGRGEVPAGTLVEYVPLA